MKFYAIIKHTNKQIEIVPDYFFSKGENLNKYLFEQNLEGNFIIPLSKLQLNKVPFKVELVSNADTFDTLRQAVNYLYVRRKYNKTEEEAKNYIQNLLLKAVMTNSSLYGRSWKPVFTYMDATSYTIEVNYAKEIDSFSGEYSHHFDIPY